MRIVPLFRASKFYPFRKRLRTPHNDACLGRKNKARAITGIVEKLSRVDQWQYLSRIRRASGITTSDLGIWNEVASERHSIPYAFDTSFRAVQPGKHQAGQIATGSSPQDQISFCSDPKASFRQQNSRDRRDIRSHV
jgi:hypothetical protein